MESKTKNFLQVAFDFASGRKWNIRCLAFVQNNLKVSEDWWDTSYYNGSYTPLWSTILTLQFCWSNLFTSAKYYYACELDLPCVSRCKTLLSLKSFIQVLKVKNAVVTVFFLKLIFGRCAALKHKDTLECFLNGTKPFLNSRPCKFWDMHNISVTQTFPLTLKASDSGNSPAFTR